MKKAQETGDPRAMELAIKMSDAMPKEKDDRVQCPYCERRYAQIVADRHIPRCKDIVNKPRPPPGKADPKPRHERFIGLNKNNTNQTAASSMTQSMYAQAPS